MNKLKKIFMSFMVLGLTTCSLSGRGQSGYTYNDKNQNVPKPLKELSIPTFSLLPSRSVRAISAFVITTMLK